MELTKEQLKDIYYENTNTVAADKLGISVDYLARLIDKHGIPKKGKSFRPNKKITIVEGK